MPTQADLALLAMQGGTSTPARSPSQADAALAAIGPGAAAAPADQSWWETVRNGVASAPIGLYLGTKQIFGGLSPQEQRILEMNKAAAKAAPVSAFAGNLLTAIPTMLLPGAQSLAGAALTGGALGLAQPVEGEQTFGNIAARKLLGAGLGAAGGAVGQAAANKVSSMLSGRLEAQVADAAAQRSLNSVRDATLEQGRAAGYVVPNSEVAPSFLGNRLESLGGKAAIKQQATRENQQVTNALARQALGVAEDQPLTSNLLENLRRQAGQAYEQIGALSPRARADLEAWKQANFNANAWNKAYARSANPDDLAKASAFAGKASDLTDRLWMHAVNNARPEYIPALRDARVRIAMAHDVENALNEATGDVSAKYFGRKFDSGDPLSGGLDTIGQFYTAFPKFMGDAATTPAAGVGKTEALAAGLLGVAGHAAAGPAGMLMGALPLASHGARNLALAKFLQASPEYGPGLLTRLGGQLDPRYTGSLARALEMQASPLPSPAQ